ncbi:helix-turn-helix domain-containing protein [Streptomyces longwoodensis]|uniref:helix-turn-helix domain-containing protein n=1 Tax=Streptomyces longwoodensis TaxID=68231 RepID=UPI0036E32F00
MYVLNVNRLRDIAAQHGDDNPHAVARRTGVSVSSTYRILSGETQPDLISALRMSVAYNFDIRAVMDPAGDTTKQPAGAAA